MKYQQGRIYFSTFINSFGSWLTFLAVALLVQEKYGGQQVAWIFLVQTLPSIIFSRGLANLVPVSQHERIYTWSQVLLAFCCLALCLSQDLMAIYIFLFVSSTIKSVSNPLFNSLVGKWTPVERTKETFTRIGSIQASTLALAPIVGAWIKIASSTELLFFIDAVTFLVSILVLQDLLSSHLKKRSLDVTSAIRIRKLRFEISQLFAGMISIPGQVPAALWKTLGLWFAFLALGALLNALEFAGFERLHMEEREIGYALAAWGVGSLVAFIRSNDISLRLICLIFILTLVFFLFAPFSWVAVAAFAVAGWSSAIFSGILRANIQNSVPAGLDTLPIWSFVNQITQVINLIAYAGVGLLLTTLGFNIFAALVIGVGLLVQTVIILPGVRVSNPCKKARTL